MIEILRDELIVGLVIWAMIGLNKQRALNALAPMELAAYIGHRVRRGIRMIAAFAVGNLMVYGFVPPSIEGLSPLAYAGCCLWVLGFGLVVAVGLHDLVTLVRYTGLRWSAALEHARAVRQAMKMPKSHYTEAEIEALPTIPARRE